MGTSVPMSVMGGTITLIARRDAHRRQCRVDRRGNPLARAHAVKEPAARAENSASKLFDLVAERVEERALFERFGQFVQFFVTVAVLGGERFGLGRLTDRRWQGCPALS